MKSENEVWAVKPDGKMVQIPVETAFDEQARRECLKQGWIPTGKVRFGTSPDGRICWNVPVEASSDRLRGSQILADERAELAEFVNMTLEEKIDRLFGKRG